MAEINLGNDTNITTTISTDTPISATVPDINYIPGYQVAEEERRANEVVRQENETQRIALYEDMQNKLETGYFDGEDGVGLQYNWNGTELGVKREDEQEYSYTDLKGDKGDPGEQGEQGDKGDPGEIDFEVVNELPETGEEDIIYLVPLEIPDVQGNNYAEYIWINNAWELLGKIGIQADLTDYVKNTDYASLSKAGVVKTNSYSGFNVGNGGGALCDSVTYSQYEGRINDSFISKGTLENVITGKGLVSSSSLSAVATSGSYDDLTNKPTIPSISDTYGTSTTNGYSQNYINSNTLNPTGDATTTQSNVSSATITNTLEAPLLIDLKGNTSQTGTPTPSSPIPVNVVSGNNTITISDGASDTTTYNIDLPVENLFQLPNNETKNYITFTKNDDGTFNLSGTATAQTSFILYVDYNEANIKDGKTYTFSANKSITSGVSVRTEVYNNTTWVRAISNELSSTAQTTTGTANLTGGNKIRYSIWVSNGSQVNITNCGIQLEEGSKANSFTPYGTTPIELNKIPNTNYEDRIFHAKDGDTYYDSLDSATKQTLIYDKWYLHKEVGKVVLNGSEEWIASGKAIFTRITNAHCLSNTNADVGDGSIDYVICDNFAINGLGDIYTYGTTGITLFYMVNNPSEIRLAFGMGDISVNDFKTWLTTHNTIVYYEYETPTNTEITYTPLIEQLNTLEQAQSKEGTTNINQVNNDLPFILDITAFLDTYDGRYKSVLEMYKRLMEAQ